MQKKNALAEKTVKYEDGMSHHNAEKAGFLEKAFTVKLSYSLICLAIIVLFALGIRLLYFNTNITLTSANYALEGYHLKEGLYDPTQIWFPATVRYVLVGLVALSFSLLGVSKFSLWLPNILFSLGTVIVIYYLGKRVANEYVGLFAAFLWAILPLDIFNATIMEADTGVTFFVTLAFYLYISFLQKQKSPLYFSIVGAVISLGLFTKIFALFFPPIIALYELFIIKNWKETKQRGFYIILGFLLISTPFILYQGHKTGDYLYNYHVEKGNIRALPLTQHATYTVIPPFNDFWIYPKFMFFIIPENELHHDDGNDPMLHIYFYLLPLACLFVFMEKKKERYLFILWFLLPFVLFESYQHIQKVQRYLLIGMVPVVLLISISLFSFYMHFVEGKEIRKVFFRFFSFIFIFFLIQVTFLQLGTLNFFNFSQYKENASTDAEQSMSAFLNILTEKDIYVASYVLSSAYPFYLKYQLNSSMPFGYHGRANYSMYDLSLVEDLSSIRNAYIIVDSHYVSLPEKDPWGYYYGMNITPLHERNSTFPQTWTILGSNDKGTIVIFNVP